jgi:hypothetical protein
MHWDILDAERTDFLPSLSWTRDAAFYLAGGTALAIHLGHRDSVDFDFFKHGSIDPDEVLIRCTDASTLDIVVTRKEPNTLSVIAGGAIRLSFFGYRYGLVEALVDTPHLRLASVRDIACMKLSAITSRSVEKDYVDLYYILRQQQLAATLDDMRRILPTLDPALVLKALVYFDDITPEAIKFKPGYEVDFETVKQFLQHQVSSYLRGQS